ncbi:hypothetical protein BB934_45750 (plasmid) [Microvirga ossetica]|uniref:Uncharacterized protein n=1 Tax=Microvirga ossetica TaxID=1882682 RepID=A0A1B2EZX9_9HYPH|nr:helix-turn-helix domain-containing protein [Microvirga ossetica]ANY85526.1 hypothetical protein BB934_45750 [Microvirga ossetica]
MAQAVETKQTRTKRKATAKAVPVKMKSVKRIDPASFLAFRTRLGLSLRQTAKQLDVDESTVKRWEWGSRDIPYIVGLAMAALEAGLETNCKVIVEVREVKPRGRAAVVA